MLVYRDIVRHCKHITRTEDLAFAFGIDITENMVRTLGNLRVGETWTIERIQSVMSIFACIERHCLAGIYDGIAAFVNMLLLEGSVDVSALDVNLAGTAMTKAIVERASICAQALSQDRPIPRTGMITQAGIMDFKARVRARLSTQRPRCRRPCLRWCPQTFKGAEASARQVLHGRCAPACGTASTACAATMTSARAATAATAPSAARRFSPATARPAAHRRRSSPQTQKSAKTSTTRAANARIASSATPRSNRPA
ncbi:hypothetical protein M885DRAFT_278535 [Pelagophyceae sp. CCMP2097]|nr:hypothetical protein M885DRAFT_278535 [Pelagophyceae sp. CCMP2097]